MTLLLNQDIDTVATLRALADEIETENVGVVDVDFGLADGLSADDPVTMGLSVEYIPYEDNEHVPTVVQFKNEDDRV